LSKSVKVVLIILLVLIIDQASKIYIKTNFEGEHVENDEMSYLSLLI